MQIKLAKCYDGDEEVDDDDYGEDVVDERADTLRRMPLQQCPV